MRNSSLVTLGSVVVAVVAASIWMLGRDTAAPEPDRVSPPTADSAGPGNEVQPLIDPGTHVMAKPFPFDTFQGEIDALREMWPEKNEKTWKDLEHDLNKRIVDEKFAVQFENVPIAEVIDVLRQKMEPLGIVVTGLDQPIPEGFELTMFRAETDVYQVIAEIQRATQMSVVYAYSEYGVCIGTERTIEEWQIQSKLRRAQDRTRSEHTAGFLSATFTMDVKDAHIGAIVQKMTADTGIEIVVDPKIWYEKRALTWRVDQPLSVRDGMQWLAKRFGAFWRVKDERVFLIHP